MRRVLLLFLHFLFSLLSRVLEENSGIFVHSSLPLTAIEARNETLPRTRSFIFTYVNVMTAKGRTYQTMTRALLCV